MKLRSMNAFFFNKGILVNFTLFKGAQKSFIFIYNERAEKKF